MYLTHLALALRQARPELFAAGDYLPLEPSGDRSANVFAFARVHGDQVVIVMAPRLWTKLVGDEERYEGGDVWGGTTLELPDRIPTGRYREVMTGAELTVQRDLSLREALAGFPVAVLERIG